MIQRNIRRYKVIEKHIEATKNGQYGVAKNLLFLLRRGHVKLGLGDVDWETERFLEEIGCPEYYSSRGYSVTFRI